MKKQAMSLLQKLISPQITKSKDIEMAEMPEKEFKNLVSNMINGVKEDLNKQMNKVRKLVQDLDKKFTNMNKKFSKKLRL
jgi:Ni,Fe-hydrogenase III large subunit